MPWSFKAVIVMFVVFVAGAGLIGFACFESGWEALGHFAWGLLTAGGGLVGGLLFCGHLCDNPAGMAKTVFIRGRPRVIALGRSRFVCQGGIRKQRSHRRL